MMKSRADLARTLSGDEVTDRRRGSTAAAATRQTSSARHISITFKTAITSPTCDALMTSTLTRRHVALLRQGAELVTAARL